MNKQFNDRYENTYKNCSKIFRAAGPHIQIETSNFNQIDQMAKKLNIQLPIQYIVFITLRNIFVPADWDVYEESVSQSRLMDMNIKNTRLSSGEFIIGTIGGEDIITINLANKNVYIDDIDLYEKSGQLNSIASSFEEFIKFQASYYANNTIKYLSDLLNKL